MLTIWPPGTQYRENAPLLYPLTVRPSPLREATSQYPEARLETKIKLRWNRVFHPVPNKKRLWVFINIHPDATGSGQVPGHARSKYKYSFVVSEKDNREHPSGIRYECAIERRQGRQDRWITTRTPVPDTRRCDEIARVYIGKIHDEDVLDRILINTKAPLRFQNTWDPAFISSGWMTRAWNSLRHQSDVIASRSKTWYAWEERFQKWLATLAERTRERNESQPSETQPVDIPASQRPRTIRGHPIIHEDMEPSPVLDVSKVLMVEFADTASTAEYSRRRLFKPLRLWQPA